MNLNIPWIGASGTRYFMELCRFGLPFANNAGVYIFCKPISTILWGAVYVGETDDFDDRLNVNLKSHHQWECIQRERATNVCVYVIVSGGRDARLAIEADLWASLDPPCNRQ